MDAKALAINKLEQVGNNLSSGTLRKMKGTYNKKNKNSVLKALNNYTLLTGALLEDYNALKSIANQIQFKLIGDWWYFSIAPLCLLADIEFS